MARRKTTATNDPPPLENVVEELSVQVQKLTDATTVLREAVDDLRMEVEWAIRNLSRPAWAPTQSPTTPPQENGTTISTAPKADEESEASVKDSPPAISDATHQGGLFD